VQYSLKNHSTLPAVVPDCPECEFCQELRGFESSRFGTIYGSSTRSRVLMRTEDFVVMPTIGQLFKGSLLIVLVNHYETIAEIPASKLFALFHLLERLIARVRSLGLPVAFEHGARSCTGGGCGIYHAHIHVVPLPSEFLCSQILPRTAHKAAGFEEAYAGLAASEQYLIFRDTYGKIEMIEEGEGPSEIFSSQYCRRVLSEYFGLESPWDWRWYRFIEPWLIQTIDWFAQESGR